MLSKCSKRKHILTYQICNKPDDAISIKEEEVNGEIVTKHTQKSKNKIRRRGYYRCINDVDLY